MGKTTLSARAALLLAVVSPGLGQIESALASTFSRAFFSHHTSHSV